MRRFFGLAIWLAFSIGLAGCVGSPQGEAPEKEGEAKPAEETQTTAEDTKADEAEETRSAELLLQDEGVPGDLPGLERLVREGRLKDQEMKVLSNHYFKTGLRLYDSYRYQEAKRSFKRSLVLDLWILLQTLLGGVLDRGEGTVHQDE